MRVECCNRVFSKNSESLHRCGKNAKKYYGYKINEYAATTKLTTTRDYKTQDRSNTFSSPLSCIIVIAILLQSWNVITISVATSIVIKIVITKNSLSHQLVTNCD